MESNFEGRAAEHIGAKNFDFRWMWLLIGCVAIASGGCYQRTVAPELTYDQSQVDSLKTQINKTEWD